MVRVRACVQSESARAVTSDQRCGEGGAGGRLSRRSHALERKEEEVPHSPREIAVECRSAKLEVPVVRGRVGISKSEMLHLPLIDTAIPRRVPNLSIVTTRPRGGTFPDRKFPNLLLLYLATSVFSRGNCLLRNM
jgi:hypothetical protein